MKLNKSHTWIILLLILILAACAPQNTPVVEPAADTEIVPTDTATPSDEPVEASTQAEAAPVEEMSEADAPYGFDRPVTAEGQVLMLAGQVLDVNGDPLPGAVVEIWQTDANGVYDHPGDSGTASRDLGFQFYGASVADAQGRYAFRTVRPGEYEPRPPHIHLKVWGNGQVVLTSQLYFSDTGNAGGLGAGADDLLVTLGTDPDGGDFMIASFDFVVDTGIGSGSLPLTPGQAEGPYYPVVNVAEFDPDLASVE